MYTIRHITDKFLCIHMQRSLYIYTAIDVQVAKKVLCNWNWRTGLMSSHFPKCRPIANCVSFYGQYLSDVGRCHDWMVHSRKPWVRHWNHFRSFKLKCLFFFSVLNSWISLGFVSFIIYWNNTWYSYTVAKDNYVTETRLQTPPIRKKTRKDQSKYYNTTQNTKLVKTRTQLDY